MSNTNKTQKHVIILRGVSGSGKSSFAEFLANQLCFSTTVCTADDYYYAKGGGEYKFDPRHLGEAHRQCQEKFLRALSAGQPNVIVANTNTKLKDFKFYLDLAETYGYKVFSLVVEKRHSNDNNHCDEEIKKKQAENILQSLKLL